MTTLKLPTPDGIVEIEDNNVCQVCGAEIFVMCYRGTSVCCNLHEKVVKEQLTIPQVEAIVSGTTREDGIK